MSLINLDLLFNAITGIANPLIKEKVQRSETVIKLLKQFDIDPEHPPADFSGVYAYGLVEYGVGKPRPVLELFRQEEIKKAFRQAFDRNNASILLSEVDDFIDAYALGDEIKDLRIDIRREIAAFYIIFSEIAKRTRNPADTMMSQQIGSLHRRIANIQEQINRLPTLEGIRTEIARLALPENVETLHVTSLQNENQCRAIALAQQMRGWFETLGYSFEKHEVWAEEYFELIINIPVRRSFDRILVRGIAGEVGLSDVMALRQSVQEQKTDEGWLVTTRRISRAARDEVKKEENRYLDCYTFDELIDLDADFSGYLNWLEAEIKLRLIDTKYVPLACTKEEIDPVTKQRIGVSRYEEEDGWIDGYIDLWLEDPVKEHISILGEFGTGKTWFAFHYAWTALQRYKDAEKRGLERPRLPVVITLRDFAKALNVENVLAGFFFTQHNIRINSDVFDQLNRMGKLLLIFDGFDEMAAKVDRQQMINNFWELAKVVVPGAKVILTCRTEHFPEAQEGRALLNAELQASTANLTGETPQFEVLELEKFNDEQIRKVLSFQAESTTVERVMGSSQLLDLARRPVMTDLILEALPDIEAGKQSDMSRVYLYAVRRKMERDIKAERTFTSLADKLYFLCELSWEMLSTDQMSLNYKLFPDRIRRLFGSIVQEQTDLDHWHYDMMGQTMLIRNANGDYTPAHRSLLEFFVAYKFAAELGALADDFTELAQAQSCLDGSAEAIEYTWSSYFSRQLDETGRSIAIAALKGFTREPLEKLKETFGRYAQRHAFGVSPLTKAVMDLMLGMVSDNEALIKVIEVTRGRSEDEVGYVGGNAATLVVNLDKGALEGKDLSGSVIKHADFSNSSLRRVNFSGANLTDSIFAKFLGRVWSIEFSPDGEILATSDNNGVISLWETASGKEILSLKGHSRGVDCVVFSPDGQILASGSRDNTMRLWNVKTGECLKVFEHGHKEWVKSLAFSSDSKLFASGSHDQTVKLWDTRTYECLQVFPGHTDRVRSVAFSADTQFLISGSYDGTIRQWNPRNGECVRIFDGHSGKVTSVAFHPQASIFISGSHDQTIKIWDALCGKCLRTLRGHTHIVSTIALSHDGKTIISGSHDKTAKLWDINTGKSLKTFQGDGSRIVSIKFNPNGKTIATGSAKQAVKILDVVTGECLRTLQGQSYWIRSITFSHDGKTIWSGSNDEVIRQWDINTGKSLKTLQGHTGSVSSITLSPDGTLLASCSDDETIKVWHLDRDKCIKTLRGHQNWVNSVAFSPNDQIIASGSNDKTIRLWDVATGECLQVLQGHLSSVRSLIFSPDGQTLVSASDDKTIGLWNPVTGECLKILQGHTDWVQSVAFSPISTTESEESGRILVSCSSDRTIRIWDISSGECVKILQGHDYAVFAVAFSPDGRSVVSASRDQTLRVWDINSGECLQILREHTNSVISVAFNRDGSLLASSSGDDSIKIWDFKRGNCIKTLKSEKTCFGMNITGVKGLSEAEKSTLKALGAVEQVE